MNFAVVQKTLDIPPVERLEQALMSVEGFTRYDAHTFANDAYGILVKNLSAEKANAVVQALYGQGIETDVVAEAEFPPLPPAKFVHRLDCTPEALVIYDPLGRDFALPWQHVMLVAAGSVRMIDFRRVQRPMFATTDSEGATYQTTMVSTVEERNEHLLLEIIVSGAVLRYSASADKLRWDYLGDRRSRKLAQNFGLLLRDLAAFAPGALLNRGAFFLKQDDNAFRYPSKNAFFEEISWLLWRMKREGRF